ncbi:MAG TPA: hypothetical protein VN201_00875 [Roseateles sp.]|nr:hypothetical protein [Roseateles sp.]
MERELIDADPINWIGGEKKPADMTRDERGDAKWCRSLATSTVALAMQVNRLMSNPAAGGALVPDQSEAPVETAEETIEAEVARFEAAAAEVLAARVVKQAKGGKSKR